MQPEPPENPDTGPVPTDQEHEIQSLLSKHQTESDLWDLDFEETQPKHPRNDSPSLGAPIPPPPSKPDTSQTDAPKRQMARRKEETSYPPDDLRQLPIPLRRKNKGPLPPSELKNIPASTEDWVHRFHDDIEREWGDFDTPPERKHSPARFSAKKEPPGEPKQEKSSSIGEMKLGESTESTLGPAAEPTPTPAKPAPAPTERAAAPIEPDSTPAKASHEPVKPADEILDPAPPTAKPARSDGLAPEIPEPKQAPPGAPLIPRIHLHLNLLERIGIIAVSVFIAVAGIYGLVRFFKDIPTRKDKDMAASFPVKGDLIRIQSAHTYWREPIRDGPEADKVRLETRLIPVLELTLSGSGNGAIRVLFRDDQGTAIGDSTTRGVIHGVWADSNQTTIRFPSTAGFDELGMYAAYRTGGTKPWRAEILEGPSPEASRSQFKKICDIAISTERR